MSIARIRLHRQLTEAMEQGATVLVPNNRLRDTVVHAYGQSRSRSVFATPQVLGVDVWARNTWNQTASLGRQPYCQRLLVSDTEEMVLWTQIVENSLDSYPLLNPEETATQASRAYQRMKQWNLHKIPADELRSFEVIPDFRVFLNWSRSFAGICARRSVISLVDCLEQLCSDLNSPGSLPVASNFVLLSFHQPPPLYRLLFEKLKNVAQVEEINSGDQEPTITTRRMEFPTGRSEFAYVANWAKELMEKDCQLHIGLVGQLSREQQNELERTLRNTLRPQQLIEFSSEAVLFNSSFRLRSLLDEALIHDAFLIFDLLQNNRQVQAESICRLLRSPYVLSNANEQTRRHRLEQELRRRLTDPCQIRNLVYLAARRGKDYSCPKLVRAIRSVQREFGKLIRPGGKRRKPVAVTPRQWSRFLIQVLRKLGWPGRKLTPFQKRMVITRFEAAFAELAELTPILGKVDFFRAVSRLRQICLNTRLKPGFDSRCQITLANLEEASDLDFDHLWILNFNDQVWPPPVSPLPFLPYPLQKELRMPGSHSDVQVELARQTFSLLLASVSGTVNISHHRSDDDQDFRPSSFGIQIAAETPGSPPSGPVFASLFGDNTETIPELIAVTDDSAVPLEIQPDGGSIGGVSILNDQSNFPFQAFIRHRLNADPQESFASGLTAAARGSAIHEALDHLFSEIGSLDDIPAAAHRIEQLCSRAALAAIEYLQKNHRSVMTRRFTQIEEQRVCKLLKKFLTVEKERGKFAVVAREEDISWHYRNMLFNLKIDRIDRLADGTLAVIDYKTGQKVSSASSWLKPRPDDLQLPFYMTAMAESAHQDDPVTAIAVAQIHVRETSYSGVAEGMLFHSGLKTVDSLLKQHPEITDWQQLLAIFRARVERIADEFADGIALIPANYDRICNNRQIRALCRPPDAGAEMPSMQREPRQ